MPVSLLAMTPSGEALIVRDERGETWIHQPESVGGVVLFDANLVEQAIAEHGLDRINREFANWQDLDQFRQERASAVTPDVMRLPVFCSPEGTVGSTV